MPTILVIDHDRAPGTIREFIKIDPTIPTLAPSHYAFTDCRQEDPAVVGSAIKVGATAAQQGPFDIIDALATVDRTSKHHQRLLADVKDRAGEASFIRRVS
ncbi:MULTISPECIES: hypothetical protein [unclassified Bradyrhizobium]|uniref:hypothetical protein n=1 Tax=unclassified Bradyrhizobium TaxID=2631580 RepID=UPI0028E58934|nr:MULTISPECIES: hypothetical protein [unclassified Bradyrhizobium]